MEPENISHFYKSLFQKVKKKKEIAKSMYLYGYFYECNLPT